MKWFAGVAAAIMLAAGSLAHAQVGAPPVLEGAAYLASANDEAGVKTITHAGGVSGAGTECHPVPLNCFTDSASAGPTKAFINGTGTESGGAARTSYFYEVFGPVDDVKVPVTLDGDVFISGADQAILSAGISWNENAGAAGVSTLDGLPMEDKPVHAAFIVLSNQVYNVVMEVKGDTCLFTCVHNAGDWEASADPHLAIDPSFLAANPGYSLIFSPGVIPGPGVPEPSTWAMMVLGLGVVGWRLRSRFMRAFPRTA
jgi:hypothetical protein